MHWPWATITSANLGPASLDRGFRPQFLKPVGFLPLFVLAGAAPAPDHPFLRTVVYMMQWLLGSLRPMLLRFA